MDLIIASFTAIVSTILSIFVYLINVKSATNRYFSGFILTLGLYSLFNYLSSQAVTNTEAFYWSKFVMYSIIPIGPLFYFFVKTFPEATSQISIRIRIFLYVFMAVQIPLIALNITLSSVEVINSRLLIHPGLGIIPMLLMHVGTIMTGAYLLVKKYRNATGLLKIQLQYITFGILVSLILTIIVTAVFGVLFNFTALIPISPLFLLIGAGTITYTIARHRFLDIRLIIVRSLAYILLLLFISIGYIAILFDVAFFFNKQEPSWENLKALIIPAILALFFAVTFQPLRRIFEKLTDKVFYRDNYDSNDLLWSLSRVMASTLDLKELAESILKRLMGALRVNYGSIVLVRDKSIYWAQSEGDVSHHPFKNTDIYRLVYDSYHATRHKEHIYIFEELSETKIKKLMREQDITIIIPLTVRKELVGGLLLGQKSSGAIYSSEDIEVLKIVAPEIAVAVKNSLSYDEIKKFNVTLEDEVRRATKRLRSANNRLKELDLLKDEFVSIASHELRTPMTAIKSYLWLALHEPNQTIKAPLKKYLNISYNSTERLIRLVNDMLTVSRIERNKIELKLEPVDILEVAQLVYDELKITADEKDIVFIFNHPKEKLMVNGDKEKLREVIQNIVGNALKFTPEKGSITIAAKLQKDMISVDIKDTASGIPKDSIGKLFQKFSKIEYSYSKHSSQPGTGLGLYISKQIVSLHKGDIAVQSEVGVGSIFSVMLPLLNKHKGGEKS